MFPIVVVDVVVVDDVGLVTIYVLILAMISDGVGNHGLKSCGCCGMFDLTGYKVVNCGVVVIMLA